MRGFILNIYYSFIDEALRIIKDKGIILLFVIAPLAYPLMYGLIYNTETLREMPIVVVDKSNTEISRNYLRQIDATPEVEIIARCADLAEANVYYNENKAHGVIVVSKDFAEALGKNERPIVTAYADMSSFMYYKAMAAVVSFVSKDVGMQIQLERLEASGLTAKQAEGIANPYTFSHIKIFNPQDGYGSFLLPIVFMLILHQTLLIGMGMVFGTSYEKNSRTFLNLRNGREQDISTVMIGKSLVYLIIYALNSFYILGFVNKVFGLPNMGATPDIVLFMLPFLLAVIFMGMTISSFLYHRESSMLLILVATIPLLFLTGMSWPYEGIPAFWKFVSDFLPSSHAINGYIRINTMGAELRQVKFEYTALWGLVALYYLTAYLSFYWHREHARRQLRKSSKAASETNPA